MSEKKDPKYEQIDKEMNDRVIRNLRALIKVRGHSIAGFVDAMQREKACFTRAYVTTILQEEKHKTLPFTFVVLCCDYLGISVQELIANDFKAENYKHGSSASYEQYVDIEKILKEPGKQDETEGAEFFPALKLFDSTALVYDPEDLRFGGYIQDYYCYYYPTRSSRNDLETGLIRGRLKLSKAGAYCRAVLQIDSSGRVEMNEDYDKEYAGFAVISTLDHNMQCIMYSEKVGEFCFLSFRHFKLNLSPQYCRVAEVLSSASGGEERCPIVLRMLLSKEEIKEEDLHLVRSSVLFNYSNILISRDDLLKLSEVNPAYSEITRQLLQKRTSTDIFFLNEQDDVYHYAKEVLGDEMAAWEFVSHLREYSCSFRYNKVTSRTDKILVDLLQSKGYYGQKIIMQ